MTYPTEPPPGGYPPPPPGNYPPPPHNGHAPPPQPYGAPPPGYPPPYGYPRKSKAPLWIGIGVGVVAIVGLAVHFVMVDNAWLHPEPPPSAPLTAEQRKAYAYIPPNQAAAPVAAAPVSTAVDQAYLAGNWCAARGTKLWFRPMGSHPSRGNLTVFPSNNGPTTSNPYELGTNVVTVQLPNQNQTLLLTKIDQSNMSIVFGRNPPEAVRRC